MIDRDQLREAILEVEATEAFLVETGWHEDILVDVLEAARLVADPDTLVITKVDGEWPEHAMLWLTGALLAMGVTLSQDHVELILDALLEGQPQ